MTEGAKLSLSYFSSGDAAGTDIRTFDGALNIDLDPLKVRQKPA